MVFGSLLTTAAGMAAEPLLPQQKAVAEVFGKATVDATRLVKSERSKGEPLVWLVFSEDTHRQGELVKIRLERQPGTQAWRALSAGAGQLLQRVPPLRMNWAKVRVGPAEARLTAEQGAKLAKAVFDSVEYQLAMQPTNQSPEWALTLFDTQGKEMGFVVLSAETGAVVHQDFTGPVPPPVAQGAKRDDGEVDSGEEAARAVKRGARKAWDWTEKAGRETGNFFRELFR